MMSRGFSGDKQVTNCDYSCLQMFFPCFYPLNPKVRIKMVGIVNKVCLLPMARPTRMAILITIKGKRHNKSVSREIFSLFSRRYWAFVTYSTWPTEQKERLRAKLANSCFLQKLTPSFIYTKFHTVHASWYKIRQQFIWISTLARADAPREKYNFNSTIVIRGDWLWKAANINDKNNSAAVYVQSTVKVHNPLFSVGKLLRNKLMQRFYWSIQSKW